MAPLAVSFTPSWYLVGPEDMQGSFYFLRSAYSVYNEFLNGLDYPLLTSRVLLSNMIMTSSRLCCYVASLHI